MGRLEELSNGLGRKIVRGQVNHHQARYTSDGRDLVINCAHCAGSQDIRQVVCLRCAARALVDHPEATILVLEGDSVVEYRERGMEGLRSMIEPLALLRKGPLRLLGGRCDECECGTMAVFEQVLGSWPSTLRVLALKPLKDGPQCALCLREARENLEAARASYASVDRRINQLAFRIAEVSE